MNNKNEIGIAAGITAIFLLVLLTGVGVYFSLNRVISQVDESAKPNVRLLLLEQVLANLATAESSVKSYNLTRDKSYLTPFYKSLVGIEGQLLTLKKRSQTDTLYQQLTDSVEQLVTVKFEILGDIIGLGNTEKVAEELHRIARQAEQSSKQALDQLRQSEEKKAAPKPKFWQRLFKKKSKETPHPKSNQKAKPAPVDVLDKVRKDINQSVSLVRREQIRQLKSLKAQELALLQLDKQVMWSIRSLVSRMQYLERKRIIYDAAEVSELVSKNNNRILIFSLTIVLLLVVVGYIIVLYIKKNYETTLALQRAKNEAESLAKAKETFLAGMSHEIRTPLNAIIGFTEQLGQEQLSKPQQSKVETIKNAGAHLLEIINEVLDYTKITAGKLVLQPVTFNPLAELQQVLSTLGPIAKNKTIQLIVDGQETGWVIGDKLRFNQVMYNLIGNAMKFTDKGNVRISLKQTEQHTPQHKITLQVQITDTGIGIAEQEIAQLFQDFGQANQSIQQRFGGSGLGLSICKRIVELQGGHLSLSSKLGEGTQVRVQLSYEVAPAQQNKSAQPITDTKAVLKGCYVLVADDNLYNRELLKTILGKWGANILEAEDGVAALDVITNTNQIDLCLIDVKMPKLNGIELTAQIRALNHPAKQHVPILALTATINNTERGELIANGVNGVLLKPFKEMELYELVSSVAPDLIQQHVTDKVENNPLPTPAGKLYSAAALHNIGDEAFVREMLFVFKRTIKAGVEKLKAHETDGNLPAIAEMAHQLIPSCRHLEVNELMLKLKHLEQLAHQAKQAKDLTPIIRQIEQITQQVTAEIERDWPLN